MTKITQADRDAAAEAFFCKPLLNEKYSDDRRVRAFARHRQQAIEQLEREKAVVYDLWEQQKEIALDYLADCNKAADRIEALQADKAKLREALRWFLNDSRFVVQVGGNPYAVPQMIEDAREALQETGQ